jgi:mono/diheme cytochrome c family protein
MISASMRRPAQVLLIMSASIAVAALAAACGTQRISVPKEPADIYQGAVLFNQRCSGCHTLSYAATNGSASNVRQAEVTNGPNFDQRCERPAERVLYAIENGGFSGAIMPQNVVVGQDARNVAMFVATYSGRSAPKVPGVTPCQLVDIGTLPEPPSASASATSTSATATAAAGGTTTAASVTTTSTATSAATVAAASRAGAGTGNAKGGKSTTKNT